MNDKPRKMNIHPGAASVDVDDLIAQADAPSPTLPAKRNQRKPETKTEPKVTEDAKPEPPWHAADKRIRKTVLLYLTEREKMMLDYIRERSSVPSQRFLSKILLPAIEKEAEKSWKDSMK